ncbi:MAG TPA: urea carboxylase-associated family protein [Chloroflexota bacterium]|nr:urea carboxylase-associated family protein [Chloroflexota bacterium]
MSLKVLRSVTVPPGQGSACTVRRGEVLRVIDIEGGQVADFNAWSLADPREKFWSARTRIMQRAHLSTGDRLWSSPNMAVMFTITADTVKPKPSARDGKSHDLLWARCSSRLWELRDGLANIANCQDNLAQAIEPHGLSVHDVHDAFNIFMKTGLDADDHLFQEEPESEPGDYLELRAEIDCLVAVSSCPGRANRAPGWRSRPLLLQVLG